MASNSIGTGRNTWSRGDIVAILQLLAMLRLPPIHVMAVQTYTRHECDKPIATGANTDCLSVLQRRRLEVFDGPPPTEATEQSPAAKLTVHLRRDRQP
jgi:hypothetical protein